MIASLINAIRSNRWQFVGETTDQLVMESTQPTAEDLSAIYPFVAAGSAELKGRLELGQLYELDVSGYPDFNQELDGHWSLLYGERVDEVKKPRRRLAVMRQQGIPRETAFGEIEQFHELAAEAGNSVRCRLVVDKVKFSSIGDHPNARTFVWFSSERFETWLEGCPFEVCISLFADPCPPLIFVAQDTNDFEFDHLVRPLTELQLASQPENVEFRSKLRELYRSKKREISSESTAGLIHPLLFSAVAEARWQSVRFRQMVAYATLCLFSCDVMCSDASFDFWFKTSAGSNRMTSVSFTGEMVTVPKSTESISLRADRLKQTLEMCSAYQDSIKESDSLRGVWAVVLEKGIGTNLAKILLSPESLVNSFKELKEALLKSNVDRLLTAHEKAQGAMIQASGQLTKDVDGLGGEVERAVMAGVGSGLLALLGSLLKVPSLDLAAPVAAGLLAFLFFPNVLGRVDYLQKSIEERKSDLSTFLNALSVTARQSLDLSDYLARFERHLCLARPEVTKARARMTLVFILVHSFALATAMLAFLRFPWTWSSYVAMAIVGGYSVCVSIWERSIPAIVYYYLALTPFIVSGVLVWGMLVNK